MDCVYKATSEPAPSGQTHYRCVNKGCGHERTSSYGPFQLHRHCNPGSLKESSTGRLGRYARALKRWVGAGKPVRNDEEVARLLAICKACDYFDPRGKCVLCGCYVNVGKNAAFNKLRMATESCPADPPRWDAEVIVDESDNA